MNRPISKGDSSALPRAFSRRSAILKIVEENALGTRFAILDKIACYLLHIRRITSLSSSMALQFLQVQINDYFIKSLPFTQAPSFFEYPCWHSQRYSPGTFTHFFPAPHASATSEHSSTSAIKIRAFSLKRPASMHICWRKWRSSHK